MGEFTRDTALQEELGKLTVEQRLEQLLDAGSFAEVGKYVQKSNAVLGYADTSAPGEGVVTGWGTIDGRAVYVVAQDYTVLKGSFGVAHADKICNAIDLASKSGLPIVFLWDSGGARLQEGIAAMDAYAKVMRKLVDVSGVVPTISMALGGMYGSQAVMAGVTDFCIVIKNISAIGLKSHTVVAATFGIDADEEKLLGAAAQMRDGNAHFICETEAKAFETAKKLLSYLPDNNLEESEILHGHDPQPIDAYTNDMQTLVLSVVDEHSFMEVQEGYAPAFRVGFASVDGVSVGVVANESGAYLTPEGCEKAARFIRFLDAYDMPILTFVDNNGAAVVKDVGLMRSLAKLSYAYSEAGCPMISLVVGSAIGEGYSVLSNKGNGADFVYALDTAMIGPINEEAGSIIFFENKNETAAYKAQFLTPLGAAQQGLVDEIITASEARDKVIRGLVVALHKRESKLPKKHGILPL